MCNARRGFTLIELMICVAIIAIIAAIAIPSLLRSRIAANETSCQATLKQIVSTEGVWMQTGSSRDGAQDYWTRDVAGFYGWSDAAGQPLKYVDISVAKADQWGAMNYPPVGKFTDKSGYVFWVMTMDENGMAYQQDPGGIGKNYANSSKYAFCGVPTSYNRTGQRQYIVNQQGVVYAKDTGGVLATTTWPGADPSTFGWTSAD